MAEHARLCIAKMDEDRLDYTMLWLFKHWDWLGRSKFGRELLGWLDKVMGLHRREVECKEFHDEVTRVYKSRGVRRIAPDRMVCASRKRDLYDLMEKRNWPRPFCPFMMQTRPPQPKEGDGEERRGGLFVMFSNWQDGFYKIIEIGGCRVLKDQSGTPIRDYRGVVHEVAVLYENQITQVDRDCRDCPCRIILDCDLCTDNWAGKYSAESMLESVRRVPVMFVKRLAEIRAIKRTDCIRVTEKMKSRKGKESYHFTFNILGMSKGEILQVLNEIFKKPFLELKELKRKGGLKVTPRVEAGGDGLISPFEIADTSTMHGNNQFSVMLICDPKKKETRNPVQTATLVITKGGEVVERVETPWAHCPNDPDHPNALDMLAGSCFTNFIPDSVTLDPRFMTFFHEGMAFILSLHARCETRTHTHPRGGGRQKNG